MASKMHAQRSSQMRFFFYEETPEGISNYLAQREKFSLVSSDELFGRPMGWTIFLTPGAAPKKFFKINETHVNRTFTWLLPVYWAYIGGGSRPSFIKKGKSRKQKNFFCFRDFFFSCFFWWEKYFGMVGIYLLCRDLIHGLSSFGAESMMTLVENFFINSQCLLWLHMKYD